MDRLQNIETFAEVAGQLSFAAAARRLGLPASTVTSRIRSLEQGLGVRLLDRTTRRVALTASRRAVSGPLPPRAGRDRRRPRSGCRGGQGQRPAAPLGAHGAADGPAGGADVGLPARLSADLHHHNGG
ncbi:LysR family transcriptional regulator [Phaeobacter sp. BS52]|uniref:helix-turn-helix domain-containing protein n=1 Tax=Phaeobacter sp. BS52 TaxID=2907241 RepID=UPI003867B6F7